MGKPLSILSYNLRFHIGYSDVERLVTTHKPQIACLQECYVRQLQDVLGHLKKATATSSGILGQAIYYDPKRFSVKSTESISMPRSVYEKVFSDDSERMLIVELYDKLQKRSFYAASLHTTHLVALNAIRRRQIRRAISVMNEKRHDAGAVIVGDFNYPFFQQMLRRMVHRLGYRIFISTEPTYSLHHFQGRFDMAMTSNHNAVLKVLPFGLSDHAPILVTLED